MNRSNPNPAPQQPGNQNAGTANSQSVKKKRFGRGVNGDSKVMRIISVVLLFSITILIVFLSASFVLGPKSERSYIEQDRLQAVFLNGGQVYFGKITDLNDKYLRMTDIFYLRVNQVVQPNQEGNQQATQNDISLVKLGCELHRPANEMLINRSQVVFWENLKEETGENTVPGAVENYKNQYPEGQACQNATNNNSNTNTNTTPSTNNGSNTNIETNTSPTNTGNGANTGTDTAN